MAKTTPLTVSSPRYTMILHLALMLSCCRTGFSWVTFSVTRAAAAARTFSLAAAANKDFFGLYDDEELWNVLNIHQQLSGDNESSPVQKEEESAKSMHESIMKSYGEETMQTLLDMHDSLKNASGSDEELERLQTLRQSLDSPAIEQDSTTSIPPSLHDLVQEAVGITDTGSATSPLIEKSTTQKPHDKNIRAIASDVDGTLLTSTYSIHPRSRQAVRRAVLESPAITFFPATGKSRKGALTSLGVEMGDLLGNVPGVFLQGLYCVDANNHVVFEQKLTTSAVVAVEQLANEAQVSVVAYDGDSLYSTDLTEPVVELTKKYGEPTVTKLPESLSDHKPGFHKILLLHENDDMLSTRVRPKLEALALENDACVTTAMPGMLEWLPAGCSKAVGVQRVCESLGINPSTELLAIGDAENDAAMLEMAAIGVAVGNASPPAQEAADYFMEETNDEGGAGAALEYFIFNR